MSEAIGKTGESVSVRALGQMRLCLMGSVAALLMTIGAGYLNIGSGFGGGVGGDVGGGGGVIRAQRFEVVGDGGRVVAVIAAHGRSAQLRISAGERDATLTLGEVEGMKEFGVHMMGPKATSEVRVVVKDGMAGIAVDSRALPPGQDAHHASLSAGGGALLMLTQYAEGDKWTGLATITPNEVRVKNCTGEVLLEAPPK